MTFEVNGIQWRIVFVEPNSDMLLRSDFSRTVGVTDGNTHEVYLSNLLRGAFLRKVCAHELCHVYCMAFDEYMPIEEEENLADWVSKYAEDLVDTLRYIMPIIQYAVA